MNKLLTFGLGVLVAAALAFPAMAFDVEPPAGPIKMELTSKPVVFDHAIHISRDCGACHETMPYHFPALAVDNVQRCVTCHHLVDGELPPMMQCSGCHSELDRTDKSEFSYFRMAHARDVAPERATCLDCHMEVIKTRPEKRQELTSCVGSSCHPKS